MARLSYTVSDRAWFIKLLCVSVWSGSTLTLLGSMRDLVVYASEEYWKLVAPNTPRHPSDPPVPPHLADSGRTYCHWGSAASCGRPPDTESIGLQISCIMQRNKTLYAYVFYLSFVLFCYLFYYCTAHHGHLSPAVRLLPGWLGTVVDLLPFGWTLLQAP